jgi:hypothetical protein
MNLLRQMKDQKLNYIKWMLMTITFSNFEWNWFIIDCLKSMCQVKR